MNQDVTPEKAAFAPAQACETAYPRYRWFVLCSAWLAINSLQIGNLAYAPLLGEIAKDLGINLGQAVHVMTVFVLFGAVSLVISGVLCDRYGIGPLIIASTLCSTVPAALTPWLGNSYPTLLCLRAFQGLSLGCVVSLSPIALQWFPPNQRGLAIGIPTGLAGMSAIIAVLGSPPLFQLTRNWQHTVAWLSVFGWVALLFSATVFWLPNARRLTGTLTSCTIQSSASEFKQVWRSPLIWIGLSLTFLVLWIVYSVNGLTASYLAVAKPVGVGLGPVRAGQLLAVVQFTAIIGPLITGMLLDRGGKFKTVLLLGFAMSFPFFCIQFSFVHGNRIVLVTCLAVLGVAASGILPTIMALGAAVYAPHTVGRIVGIWLGVGTFGGAAGLFVNGELLRRTGYYSAVIDLLAVAIAIGFVLSFFVVSEHPG